MSAHPAVECLRERLPHGLEVAALAAARAAPREALADWAGAAAMVADDGAVELRLRLAALLCVAFLGQRGAPVPAAALGALGDDVLVDAALEEGVTTAITGIVAASGDRLPVDDRRYLARRLAAAGAGGEHVAALQLAAGDLPAAATALARGLEAVLGGDAPGEAALAVAHLAVIWTDAHGAVFGDALAAALRPGFRDKVADAARATGAGDRHPLLLALAR